MENSEMLRRVTLVGWADLPTDLLVNIFGILSDHMAVSKVCIHWRRALLMLPRPVLLRPVVDSQPPDPLPLAPVDMELLVPSNLKPPNAVLQMSTVQRDSPFCYSYIAVSSPSLDSDLRFVGASSGVPLFVDDLRRQLEVRRLVTLPGAQGTSAEPTVLTVALPEGLQPLDIYLGSMVVSTGNWPPAGITSILLVTRSEFLGIMADNRDALSADKPLWFRLKLQGERRTFVSILVKKNADADYYILDASKRLSMISLCSSASGCMIKLKEMPVEGGLRDELLSGALIKTWLLYLPKWDHSGYDVVCLAYRLFDLYGCFVSFDLVEETPRHWAERISIGAGFCVFLGWGPGAAAFGYRQPRRIGLRTNTIYDCQSLAAYRMGWNYTTLGSNPLGIMPPTTALGWPFPMWLEPAYPSYPWWSPPVLADDALEEPVNGNSPLLLGDSDIQGP